MAIPPINTTHLAFIYLLYQRYRQQYKAYFYGFCLYAARCERVKALGVKATQQWLKWNFRKFQEAHAWGKERRRRAIERGMCIQHYRNKNERKEFPLLYMYVCVCTSLFFF